MLDVRRELVLLMRPEILVARLVQVLASCCPCLCLCVRLGLRHVGLHMGLELL